MTHNRYFSVNIARNKSIRELTGIIGDLEVMIPLATCIHGHESTINSQMIQAVALYKEELARRQAKKRIRFVEAFQSCKMQRL